MTETHAEGAAPEDDDRRNPGGLHAGGTSPASTSDDGSERSLRGRLAGALVEQVA